MPREQPELGIRKPYSARYKITTGPAKGIDDSHDPSTLPDENVVEGINTRIHDGIMVSRGGQEAVLGAGSGLTGCVYGMVDVEGSGVSGGGGGGDSFYLRVDNPSETWDQLYVYTPPGTIVSCSSASANLNLCMNYNSPRTFVRFNGQTVVGVRDYYPTLVIVELINPTTGDDSGLMVKTREVVRIVPPAAGPYPMVHSLAVLPATGAGAVATGASASISDTLFIGTIGGIGVPGAVYAWNPDEGLVLLADDFPTDYGVYVFVAHGTLWAASTNDVRRLNYWTQGKSLSQATWTSVTGLPALIQLLCSVEYRGDAYVAGIDNLDATNRSIFKISSPLGAAPSLTQAHAITPGGLGDSTSIVDMIVAKEGLVYGWMGHDPADGADTGDAVGLFDGTTWADTHFLIDMSETAGQTCYRLYPDAGGSFYYLRKGGFQYDDENLGVIRRWSNSSWTVYMTSADLAFVDIILR